MKEITFSIDDTTYGLLEKALTDDAPYPGTIVDGEGKTVANPVSKSEYVAGRMLDLVWAKAKIIEIRKIPAPAKQADAIIQTSKEGATINITTKSVV